MAQEPHTHERLRQERTTISAASIRAQVYYDCLYTGSTFNRVAYQHCRFERVSFRGAKFNQVQFFNCRFIDCNFDTATFNECDLKYSEFTNCQLKYIQIRLSLPTDENIRRNLLRNLRMNAEARGRADDARWTLLDELEASKKHLWRCISDSKYLYYCTDLKCRRQKLQGLLVLYAADVLWGHGERWSRVLRNAAIVIIVYAIMYSQFGSWTSANGPIKGLGVVDSIGYSVAAFITTNYGTIAAHDVFTRVLSTSEGVLGLIVFGLLVAAIYRQVSKR